MKPFPDGGTLYIGGWSRGATATKGMAVVDFTASMDLSTSSIQARNPAAQRDFAGLLMSVKDDVSSMLHMEIKDFGVPQWSTDVWRALATDVTALLQGGRDVLIACSMGHGRSGMGASILCYMISPEVVGNSPIEWLRTKHCKDAIETEVQVQYIYSLLALGPVPDGVKGSNSGKVYTQSGYSSGYAGTNDPTYLAKNHSGYPIKPSAGAIRHQTVMNRWAKWEDWWQEWTETMSKPTGYLDGDPDRPMYGGEEGG